MNVIVIASIVIILTLLFGALIAVVVHWFSRAVTREQMAMEVERNSYNPSLSIGHPVPVADDYDKQLKAARELAAKRAARTPRGGNLGIGLGATDKRLTTFQGLDEDPVSAVKIAQFHGWEGLRTGATSAMPTATAAAKAPTQTAAPVKSVGDLVPGEDYPLVEITDEMSPAEKRKARIANAKAKSAAVKAFKQTATAVPAATVESPETVVNQPTDITQSAAESAAVVSTSTQPVPGVDYEVIEITDDMAPDEKRKARIANVKAKSVAMKAFKAAGGTSTLPAPAQEASHVVDSEAPPAPTVKAEVTSTDPPASVPLPADVPQPDYIDIKDDMDPADVRKARIHNAKERAAYNKALKAAGIDPASVT